ncbi:hypothetical protein [Rubritalea profundi]|uniref:hypothetical protein n=1 Tax=Rubritalea profundi TaxID=1658618 RepID=UPI00101ADC3B|nr:hypothetical protein [Rubritalea profundi]
MLTLEASRNEEEDYAALSLKARTAISNIFDDTKSLEGYQSILRKDVLSSVFAKAYGFGSYKVNEWPTSPLNLVQVYEQVVFPPSVPHKKPPLSVLPGRNALATKNKVLSTGHLSRSPRLLV